MDTICAKHEMHENENYSRVLVGLGCITILRINCWMESTAYTNLIQRWSFFFFFFIAADHFHKTHKQTCKWIKFIYCWQSPGQCCPWSNTSVGSHFWASLVVCPPPQMKDPLCMARQLNTL